MTEYIIRRIKALASQPNLKAHNSSNTAAGTIGVRASQPNKNSIRISSFAVAAVKTKGAVLASSVPAAACR